MEGNTTKKRFLVIMKDEFVRDAQAYCGDTIDLSAMDDDDSWRDIHGSVVVYDGVTTETREEVLSRLMKIYGGSYNREQFEIIEAESCEIDNW